MKYRFSEQYNSYITDNENLKYYKIKYASNFGEFENYAQKFNEIESYRDNGIIGGNIRASKPKIPDYPMF
jgi:hypothetical protein